MSENTNVTRQSLKNQTMDYVSSATKAVLGAVPFAGSLLVELACTIIPNQRIDRLAKFAMELERRLNSFDQEQVRTKLTDENFTDLAEEAMRQAARSVTDERRRYIAALLANGICSDVTFIESKHLMRILSDLNDIELIWLRYYLDRAPAGDKEFRTRHREILEEVFVYMGPGQQRLTDKKALQDNYKEHLVQLGLLERRYEIDSRTDQLKFNTFTQAPRIAGYQITPLGELMLRQLSMGNAD